MFGLIFGLLSLTLLSFYSMFHTFFYIKKIDCDPELQKKYKRFAINIGLLGGVSLSLTLYMLSLL